MRTLEIDGQTVEYDIGTTAVGYVVSMDARSGRFPFPRVGDVERIGRKWRAVVGPDDSGRDHYARAESAPVYRTMRQAVEHIIRAAMPTDDAVVRADRQTIDAYNDAESLAEFGEYVATRLFGAPYARVEHQS